MVIQVNAQKTNFLVIHRGTKNIELGLFYGNEQIKYDPNPRFLGVTLDKNLLLNKHAEIITTRAQKRINMLRRIRGHDWGLDERLNDYLQSLDTINIRLRTNGPTTNGRYTLEKNRSNSEKSNPHDNSMATKNSRHRNLQP